MTGGTTGSTGGWVCSAVSVSTDDSSDEVCSPGVSAGFPKKFFRREGRSLVK